jgi:hypothetical protein
MESGKGQALGRVGVWGDGGVGVKRESDEGDEWDG